MPIFSPSRLPAGLGFLLILALPQTLFAVPGDSVQDRLDRIEELLNSVNDDVEAIVVGRSSASLNASVCVSTGVGTALTLAATGQLGARWDLAVLADGHGQLDLGITGDSTMAANVCIDVPIVSIGETAIPTSADRRITLTTADSTSVSLTAAETLAFDDALAQVAADLKATGMTMSGGLGQIWYSLNAGSMLNPEDNPLLYPDEVVASVPSVVMNGTLANTPFERLPLAYQAEEAAKSLANIDPCQLAQSNQILSQVPGLDDLVCDNPLLNGVAGIADDVADLPGLINQGFDNQAARINNGFGSLTSQLNQQTLALSVQFIDGFRDLKSTITTGVGTVATRLETFENKVVPLVQDIKATLAQIQSVVNNVNGTVNSINSTVASISSSLFGGDGGGGLVDDVVGGFCGIFDC